MDNHLHDAGRSHAEQVTPISGAVARTANPHHDRTTPSVYESNSYHGAAIRDAEQARLGKLYPRLYL